MVMVVQAVSVMIKFDFESVLEMLQVRIQYELNKYFIGPDAVAILKQNWNDQVSYQIYSKLDYSLPAVEQMQDNLLRLFILYLMIICAYSFFMQPEIIRSLIINGYVCSKDTFSMLRMTMIFKTVSIFMQFSYTWKLCELLQTFD